MSKMTKVIEWLARTPSHTLPKTEIVQAGMDPGLNAAIRAGKVQVITHRNNSGKLEEFVVPIDGQISP